jgi:hypothetical protein
MQKIRLNKLMKHRELTPTKIEPVSCQPRLTRREKCVNIALNFVLILAICLVLAFVNRNASQ